MLTPRIGTRTRLWLVCLATGLLVLFLGVAGASAKPSSNASNGKAQTSAASAKSASSSDGAKAASAKQSPGKSSSGKSTSGKSSSGKSTSGKSTDRKQSSPGTTTTKTSASSSTKKSSPSGDIKAQSTTSAGNRNASANNGKVAPAATSGGNGSASRGDAKTAAKTDAKGNAGGNANGQRVGQQGLTTQGVSQRRGNRAPEPAGPPGPETTPGQQPSDVPVRAGQPAVTSPSDEVLGAGDAAVAADTPAQTVPAPAGPPATLPAPAAPAPAAPAPAAPEPLARATAPVADREQRAIWQIPGELLQDLRSRMRAAVPAPLGDLPGRTFEVPLALLALLGAYLLVQGRIGQGRLPMTVEPARRHEDHGGFDL